MKMGRFIGSLFFELPLHPLKKSSPQGWLCIQEPVDSIFARAWGYLTGYSREVQEKGEKTNPNMFPSIAATLRSVESPLNPCRGEKRLLL